jgi:sulfur carrier protein ThiS
MAHVVLIGSNFRQLAGGTAELALDVANVSQLFRELGRRFPELAPHLNEGVAVAIDGQIYQDDLFQEIGPDSEVHVLSAIAGG